MSNACSLIRVNPRPSAVGTFPSLNGQDRLDPVLPVDSDPPMPAPKSKKTTSRKTTAFPELEVPPAHDWRTTDQDEINRRKLRYAFVLTGTPIENRIDELHSLMDFLNPEVLGPLFRFNRDFYSLDERGRPEGYRNLDRLHARVAPYMIRRRKADVETELPRRTDHVRFVEMTSAQRTAYEDHEVTAKRIEDTLSNAGRNLKMARVLGESGFTAEARPPLLEAIRQIGGAVAIQNHLPSPRQPADCLRPPMSAHWKDQLPTLDQSLRDEAAPVTPIITLLTNTASSCRPSASSPMHA